MQDRFWEDREEVMEVFQRRGGGAKIFVCGHRPVAKGIRR